MSDSMGKRERANDDRPLLSAFHGIHFHEPVHDDHDTRIAIMAQRYANNQDLWTGNERNTTVVEVDDSEDE